MLLLEVEKKFRQQQQKKEKFRFLKKPGKPRENGREKNILSHLFFWSSYNTKRRKWMCAPNRRRKKNNKVANTKRKIVFINRVTFFIIAMFLLRCFFHFIRYRKIGLFWEFFYYLEIIRWIKKNEGKTLKTLCWRKNFKELKKADI